MKTYKEIILSILAFLCGVAIAYYSSIVVSDREFDIVILYGFLLTLFSLVLFCVSSYYFKKKYKGTIYLLYSTKDNAIATFFKENLRSRGYRCLPDEESYKIGDNIYEIMDRDLNRSKALLAIISANSQNLKLVDQSIKLSKRKKKKILPIIVGDVETPNSLTGILSTDYNPSPDKALYLVLEALEQT